MTVIENSFELRKKLALVVKSRVTPVYGVPGRCLETAFSRGCHLFICTVRLCYGRRYIEPSPADCSVSE